jgi:predicted N-acetyltransferase YhbS
MRYDIRVETKADQPAVEDVVQRAFAQAEHTDGNEHNLVHALRLSPNFAPELSLVAEVNGRIVGHILFTPIAIQSEDASHASLALAPVSVLPEYQRIGIGAALIKAGHERAQALGHTSVILLGHATYYPRFGYQPASTWKLKAPFEIPDEAFMALELKPEALKDIHGTVVYPKEFGI